jgi:proteasome accessory factor B
MTVIQDVGLEPEPEKKPEKKRLAMKSGRIGRVVQILTTLQAGKKYSVGDLSEIFGTSRRTIFRDLKELSSIGVPFHYDASMKGITIDPEFFLPPIDLNLQEALSILLLVGKMRTQIQLPFKHSALLAALKIENNLPAKIRQFCNTTLRNISTKADAQAPASSLDIKFSQLQQAITTKHKVEIRYHSLFEGKDVDLDLCPYHLMYNRRAWYVLGFSSLHESIRTFKLNRIKELTTLDKCFLGGEDFDPAEFLGRAWSMIPEGRIYNIKLRFLPMVAENVSEVQWHSTQKVTRNGDGSATVEFRVDGLGEITWWILVGVFAPKCLQQKVVETAKSMIKLNS